MRASAEILAFRCSGETGLGAAQGEVLPSQLVASPSFLASPGGLLEKGREGIPDIYKKFAF